MTTAFLGHQSKFGTFAETTYGVGTVTDINQFFAIRSESIAKFATIVSRDGIRATRSHVSEDTRLGPYSISGTLVMQPSPDELAIWLPRICGGSGALAETLPSFTAAVDRGHRRFVYTGCKVDRATIRGQQGGLIEIQLDIIGKDEAVSATAMPSQTLTTQAPFIFSDLTLTLQSASRETREFELVIDNALITDRFMNSQTVVSLPEGDRRVALKTIHAYESTNHDLYGQALAGSAGTLSLVNGGLSLAFNFGTLQVPAESPTVNGRSETLLTLHMIARKSGGTAEVSYTLDSTP